MSGTVEYRRQTTVSKIAGPIEAPDELTGNANLTAWYVAADTNITETGGVISQWDDLSGNDNHLLQATGSSQPSWNSSGYITFKGTDDNMAMSDASFDNPVTIYIVMRVVSRDWYHCYFDGYTDGTGRLTIYDGPVTIDPDYYMAGTTTNGPYIADIATNTWYCFTIIFDETDASIRLNNGTASTGTVLERDMNGFTLGSTGNNTNYSNFDVREIVLMQEVNSGDTQTAIINYFNTKYEIW
jgi:hypothetical protein